MDYEELHKKSLEVAKKLIEKNPELKDWVESTFPELREKENDDEKIRNYIIDLIKEVGEDDSYHIYHYDDMLKWLEKKGKQKSFDNVEPKFKVGDWIVFNGLTLYIKEVVKGYYRTISKGGITNSYDWDIDNAARLWAIQDAKDGDVLFYDAVCGFTFIYNGINPEGALLYSYVESNDGSPLLKYNIGKPNVGIGYATDKNIYPATKEQRDTLFAKMKEAGYEWDVEKRELKKIEQKSWSEEDERCLTNAIDACKQMSDEDYDCLQGCIDAINWLKSIKERVQSQTKNIVNGIPSPIFAIGDTIKAKPLPPGVCGINLLADWPREIVDITDKYYILSSNQAIEIRYQDQWELAK